MGGASFLLKIPGGGVSQERRGGGGGRGAGRVSAGICFGGGLNIFFRGRNAPRRKRPVLLRANFVLTKDRKRPYYRHFCGKMHREGSCSKAAGGP